MKRWQDWVMLVLGVWLFLSPFILGYPDFGSTASVNSFLFGIIVSALALAALGRPQMWEEWVNLVLGLWLIVAPFALMPSSPPETPEITRFPATRGAELA